MKHRFDDDNCYPQSREDNIFLDGNYPRYTMVMAEKL